MSSDPNKRLGVCLSGGMKQTRRILTKSRIVTLREIRTQVVPAAGTELPVDAVAFDLGFVAHELFRRARRVLDLKGDAVTRPFLGYGLVTERTRCHVAIIVT